MQGQHAHGLPWWLSGKESTCRRPGVRSLGWEDPLEKEMATHSSILAWEIPRTKEPGGHSPWGHKRVEHDLVAEENAPHFRAQRKGLVFLSVSSMEILSP